MDCAGRDNGLVRARDTLDTATSLREAPVMMETECPDYPTE